MKKTLTALALILASSQLSCGTPSYCNEGSFPTFLDSEWRTYCAEFDDHMEEIGSYSLPELTSFYAAHPAKVAELNESLAKYESPAACFVEKTEQLEYRKLNSCLSNDDAQNQAIGNAWVARAQPWLEDHKLRLGEITPKIGDQLREARRLETKVAEAFEFKAEMDPAPYIKFADENEVLAKQLEKTADIEGEWKNLLKIARDNETLVGTMQAQYGSEVTELIARLADARSQFNEVMEAQRYLEMGTYAAGKGCPAGLRSNAEISIARKALASKVKEVRGTMPRASTGIAKELIEELETESFEGFLCAPRGKDNQFADKPQLCAVYGFVLQRDRPVTERAWGDWTLTSFEEGGPKAGVDCAIMK